METYRPQNLNTYVKFDIQSEFELENRQLLRLDTKFQENVIYALKASNFNTREFDTREYVHFFVITS